MVQPDFILTGAIATPAIEREFSTLQRKLNGMSRGYNLPNPFAPMAKDAGVFGQSLDRANQRVIAFTSSVVILGATVKVFRDIVQSTVAVERAFTEINSVFGLTSNAMDKFGKDLFTVARDTAQSFLKVSDAAREFSRQGLDAAETLKRTRDAMILTRLAGIEAAESVETLTAAVNGFHKAGLDTTTVLNKMATVDAAFAVSSRDLAQGLARAGSAASDAGVSFDQLIGLVTAAQQTTARGGAVIGNALKSIFTRIERRGTVDALESLGVTVRDTAGEILPAINLLSNFSKAYDGLGSSVKKSAAELVGGVFQINILKALLGDLEKAQSIYAQATNISATATDEAIKRNELLNKSLSSVLAQLKAVGTQVGANIGSLTIADPAKGVLSTLVDNPVTNALRDASGQAETAGGKFAEGFLRGVGNVLVYGLAPLIFNVLRNLTGQTFRKLFGDIQELAGITKVNRENQAVQSQINALYNSGDAALKKQLSTMTSIGEKAAFIQSVLAQSNATAARQAAEISAIAGTIQARGFRTPRPRAAEGYIPTAAIGYVPTAIRGYAPPKISPAQERATIARGVGATSGLSRPVLLPDLDRSEVATAAGGYIPMAARGIGPIGLRRGATEIGRGSFGAVLKSPDRDIVFKRSLIPSPEYREENIRSEYAISKLSEQMGLPVARVFGTANRSVKRGGLYKEFIEGIRGDQLPRYERDAVAYELARNFRKAGINPVDLEDNAANYIVRQGEGRDIASLAKRAVVVDPGNFTIQMNRTGGEKMPAYNRAYYSRAGGYIPAAAGGRVSIPFAEEQSAISAGVGGAPASARPVLLPSFNFGGGKKGPLVANTSEFIVPNFAGGGSAIFNQEMAAKYGLPAGAKPIAAQGHIPTAAFGTLQGMPGINSPFDYPQSILRSPRIVPASGIPTAQGQGFGQYAQSLPAGGTTAASVDPQKLARLNDLFSSISKASSLQAAYPLGEQIADIAKSLDKVTSKKVLKDLAGEIDRLYVSSQKAVLRREEDFTKADAEVMAQRSPVTKAGAFKALDQQRAEEARRKEQEMQRGFQMIEKARPVPTKAGLTPAEIKAGEEAMQLKNLKFVTDESRYAPYSPPNAAPPSGVQALARFKTATNVEQRIRNLSDRYVAPFQNTEAEAPKNDRLYRLLTAAREGRLMTGGAGAALPAAASGGGMGRDYDEFLERTKENHLRLERQAEAATRQLRGGVMSGGGGGRRGGGPRTASAASPDDPIPPARPMTDRETERVRKVARQQRVEETQARRQEEIVAQNKRLERLRERLKEGVERTAIARASVPLPVPPPPRQGLFQRLNSRFDGGRRLGFQIGAPLLAGFVPQAGGGTAAGQLGGAASGALNFGAFGAMFGLPGLIGGALVGGVAGFIGKMNKSFEELANEIQEANTKNAEQVNSASRFVQAQNQIGDAIRTGSSPKQIQALLTQGSGALAGITSAADRKTLLSAAASGDQQALGDALAEISERAVRQAQANDVLSAAGRGRNSASRLSGDFKTEDLESVAQKIAAAFNAPANKGAFAQFQQSGDFRDVAKTIGLNEEGVAQVLSSFSRAPGQFEIVLKRFKEIAETQIKEGLTSAETLQRRQTTIQMGKLLRQASTELGSSAQISEVTNLSSIRLGLERSRAAIGFTGGPASEQLQASNVAQLSAAQRENETRMSAAFQRSVSQILDKLAQSEERKLSPQGFVGKLRGVTDEGDLKTLANTLQDNFAPLRELLLRSYEELSVMRASNEVQEKELAAIQRLQEIQAQFQQRESILSKSQFSPELSESFFRSFQTGQTRAIGRFPRAQQAGGLLETVEALDRGGLEETGNTRGLRDALRGGLAQADFADKLSTILGRSVEESGLSDAIEDALSRPVNTLNDAINRDVVERIQKGLANLSFNPAEDLKRIGGDVAGAVSSGTLSLREGAVIQALQPLSDISTKLGVGSPIVNALSEISGKLDRASTTEKVNDALDDKREAVARAEGGVRNVKTDELSKFLTPLLRGRDEEQTRQKLQRAFPANFAFRPQTVGSGGPGVLAPVGENNQRASIEAAIRDEFRKSKNLVETFNQLREGSLGEPLRAAGGDRERLNQVLDEQLSKLAPEAFARLSSGDAVKAAEAQLEAAKQQLRFAEQTKQIYETLTAGDALARRAPFLARSGTFEGGGDFASNLIDYPKYGRVQIKEQALEMRTGIEERVSAPNQFIRRVPGVTGQRIPSATVEVDPRTSYQQLLERRLAEPKSKTSGSTISTIQMTEASRRGLDEGDIQGSFQLGFQSVFAGLKRDFEDLSTLGQRLGENLQSSLGNAFGDFVTGAASGKDAFRSFMTSVLGDASRMIASKALQAVLFSIPGFTGLGKADGGAIGRNAGGPITGYARGGAVPALLTGGEFYFGPDAVKRIGHDSLKQMNRYADGGFVAERYANGGVVRGGSGVRDDVPARLPRGSFILRKSSTQKIGPDYLQALADGKVEGRFWGGALTGALLGGGLGYATGGKKGAIGGAIAGGIAGGLYSYNKAATAATAAGNYQAAPSLAMKTALGLGAAAGLGMVVAGMNRAKQESSYISNDQVHGYRAQLEREQRRQLDERGAGKQVFLQINPQGGYSLAGFDPAPATRRWAEGGGVDIPLSVTPSMSRSGGSSGAPQVNIQIDINNNGSATSSSTSSTNAEPFGEGSAGRLERVVKGWVQEEMVRQTLPDGFMAQRSRFTNSF